MKSCPHSSQVEGLVRWQVLQRVWSPSGLPECRLNDSRGFIVWQRLQSFMAWVPSQVPRVLVPLPRLVSVKVPSSNTNKNEECYYLHEAGKDTEGYVKHLGSPSVHRASSTTTGRSASSVRRARSRWPADLQSWLRPGSLPSQRRGRGPSHRAWCFA